MRLLLHQACCSTSDHVVVVVMLVFYGPLTLFRRGQLASPHCSWTSLLGSLPVMSAHSFTSNWRLSLLNQRKGGTGCINYFMTNLHEIMLPDVSGLNPWRDCQHIKQTCIRPSYQAQQVIMWMLPYLVIMLICSSTWSHHVNMLQHLKSLCEYGAGPEGIKCVAAP